MHQYIILYFKNEFTSNATKISKVQCTNYIEFGTFTFYVKFGQTYLHFKRVSFIWSEADLERELIIPSTCTLCFSEMSVVNKGIVQKLR